MAPIAKKMPDNERDVRDVGFILGSGRSPGEGNGNPLQCSCLENPRDGGAWLAAVYGVAQSRTRLKRLSSSSSSSSSGSLGLVASFFSTPPGKSHGWRSLVGHSPYGFLLQYPSGKIPWMEEPGGPQSMGSLRVGHS